MISPSGAWPRFHPVGDTGLLIEFGNEISAAANDRVLHLDRALTACAPAGLIELVPAFCSLLIEYDPRQTSCAALIEIARDLASKPDLAAGLPHRRLFAPICYDPPYGEDLREIASVLGRSEQAIIDAHLQAGYRVCMLGFMPGFAYLSGLPEMLHLPRRPTPRPPVAANSVLIGGGQAAIAAASTRTGWYALGCIAARSFDADRATPFLFQAGDRIAFQRVEAAWFRLNAFRAVS